VSVEFRYCPRCSESLIETREDGHLRMKCGACGYIHYRNPAPAAGVLVLEDGRVLLVKRRFEPYRGKWSIPSGFIEYDEEVGVTAARELLEETGLVVEIDGLHAVETCFDDPRGNTLLVLYRGHVTGGDLKAGDDAEDVRFFPLDDLPDLAFEAHRKVLGELS
jgi:ADP-ribose pyrophosphatase YjhB (NUDIX family)